MKILVTGATGYIGKRLIPNLQKDGHEVVCSVRDRSRFKLGDNITGEDTGKITVIECDFLKAESLGVIPDDIDAAYYLIHSMSGSVEDFQELEKTSARNFKDRIEQTRAKQVIYLSGIINTSKLSKHLSSRKAVEAILSEGSYNLTTLRAGIIVGSGSASFEIIRDLVEKLPVMIAPRWLNTRSQPISIRNVLQFLKGVLMDRASFQKSFDVGGPEILTYKQMLLLFARVRGLKRRIMVVPVMTPKLSSYWLYFITSTSYKLAVNLVDSMKVEVVAKENDLAQRLNIRLMSYEESVRAAFNRMAQQEVISSWTDAQSSQILEDGVSNLIHVPVHGCFTDQRETRVSNPGKAVEKIWSIGGSTGWYYANWLWKFRGFLDKLFGGVGLRRGRKSMKEITPGSALDFWRVLYANKEEQRLLLYAEMKLPGEAWLEFRVTGDRLSQVATFRPLGLKGRIYWYIVFPFHEIVFRGMLRRLAA